MKQVFALVAAVALIGLCTAPALADADRRGAFVGIAYGNSKAETRSSTDSSSCSPVPCNFSEDDDTWKVYGGYRFSKWAAFEAAWQDFGEFDGVDPNTNPATTIEFAAEGLALWIRGNVPLGPVDLFGKLGGLWWDSDWRVTGPAGQVRGSTRGLIGGLGLGVMVNLGGFGIRLEGESYNTSELSRFDSYTLGVQWRFGAN